MNFMCCPKLAGSKLSLSHGTTYKLKIKKNMGEMAPELSETLNRYTIT